MLIEASQRSLHLTGTSHAAFCNTSSLAPTLALSLNYSYISSTRNQKYHLGYSLALHSLNLRKGFPPTQFHMKGRFDQLSSPRVSQFLNPSTLLGGSVRDMICRLHCIRSTLSRSPSHVFHDLCDGLDLARLVSAPKVSPPFRTRCQPAAPPV
jgi:hypothetical protein